MRRHYYGSDHGIPLDAFLQTKVEEKIDPMVVRLLSVDAVIVANELLVRSQVWALLPRHRRDEFVTKDLLHYLYNHP